MQKYRLLIPCAIGVERALGNELRHLGFTIADSEHGRFELDADIRGITMLLRVLRSAERVLLLLGQFPAADFGELFDGARSLDWPAWFHKDAAVHIDKVRTRESRLASQVSVQASVQKAIYQKLGEHYHVKRLPESGKEQLLRVYIEKDVARIFLDLSGEALHKRGYRREAGLAPLKETIAAAMIILTGWRRKFPFHDPFCGSGTLALEALMFAADIAPNLGRDFALSQTSFYDARADGDIRQELRARIRLDNPFTIRGSDIDPAMKAVAERNLKNLVAGLELGPEDSQSLASHVSFQTSPMEDIAVKEEHGFFICNPPYGERMGDKEEAERLSASLRCLGLRFPGWALGVVSTLDSLDSIVERKAEWRKPIHNGNSEAFLYLFPALS